MYAQVLTGLLIVLSVFLVLILLYCIFVEETHDRRQD